MPKHKRQHFLAQQQMRRWSKTGKSVSALDKKIPKIIKRLSIKNTGQQDHYYEKQPVGVEAALGKLEAQMKKAIDRIHEKQELPTLENEDRFTLMAYATTQLVRKEQAAGPAREAMRTIVRDTLEIMEKEGKVPPRPAELEGIELKAVVEDQWPRQMAVATGMETWPMLADLEVMLLKSNRRRMLLLDEGALQNNRIAVATGSPSGIGSMGTCLMLPVGPEYCVVWYDWGVYRRIGPGKIHEMTEEEELELGARSILSSERLTYFEEGKATTKWCIECAKHAWEVQQAGGGWRPIPGLETPKDHKWDELEPQIMGIPARPHIRRVLERARARDNEEEERTPPDEVYRAIVTELEKQFPGKLESLNEGR